ncbi:hypothetical protein AGR5A_Cc180061 [Agrobacterium genomosp. 5 str. CFBP 6626]|nr:hypothetical protein AGR5A_Cc180061 [Agrobacterium genomosp. 5 str. CFBP 6626]
MGGSAGDGKQGKQQGKARSWRHILSPGKLRAHRENPAGTVKAEANGFGSDVGRATAAHVSFTAAPGSQGKSCCAGCQMNGR